MLLLIPMSAMSHGVQDHLVFLRNFQSFGIQLSSENVLAIRGADASVIVGKHKPKSGASGKSDRDDDDTHDRVSTGITAPSLLKGSFAWLQTGCGSTGAHRPAGLRESF